MVKNGPHLFIDCLGGTIWVIVQFLCILGLLKHTDGYLLLKMAILSDYWYLSKNIICIDPRFCSSIFFWLLACELLWPRVLNIFDISDSAKLLHSPFSIYSDLEILNFVIHAVNLIFDPGMKELTILPEVIFVIHRADNEFEIQQLKCVEPCWATWYIPKIYHCIIQ